MANNIIKRTWKQGGLVNIEDLRGSAFQAESGGHTFQISGVDIDGNPLALSGTPAGVLLRADGQDVALTCSVSDGVVSATLPANAYVVPGRVGITIFLTSDGQKTAIYAAVGSVATTSSGTVAPPAGSDVVDLVNAIATAVATIPASYTDLMAAVAPTYSTSALYAVGSYAWYDGKLYRCTTAITTAETWTSGHWTLANLGSDVSDLKSALELVTDSTRNIFDVYKLGYPLDENGYFSRTATQLNNAFKNSPGITSGITFKENTRYTFSVTAYTTGTSGTSGNGILFKIKYTDNSTATSITYTNNTSSPKRTSVTSNANKTISYIGVEYATQGGNKWYIKDIQIEEGASVTPFIQHSTANDLTARGRLAELGGAQVDTYEKDVTDDIIWTQGSGVYVPGGTTSTSTNAANSSYVDVEGFDFVNVTFRTIPESNNTSYGAAFYDENKSYITGEYSAEGKTGDSYGAATKNLRIPSSAKFVRVTWYKNTTEYYSQFDFSMKLLKISETDKIIGYARPFYQTEIADTVEKIRKAQNEPNVSFWWFTDAHFMSGLAPNSGKSLLDMTDIMRIIDKKCKIDFILNTGDNFDGNYVRATCEQYINEINPALISVGIPVITSVGNHDTHYSYSSNADPFNYMDQYRYYLSTMGFTAHFNESTNGTDYYFDNEALKIRFIVINTNTADGGEYKFDKTATNEWIENVALVTPDGYDVVFFAHLAPLKRHNIGFVDNPSGGAAFAEMIEGYETESKKIIAYIYGHSHRDATFAEPYLGIASGCQKAESTGNEYEGWVKPARQLATVTEQLFNAMVIKPYSHIINLIRFGAGTDRTIHYDITSVDTTVTLTPSITVDHWETLDSDVATVSDGVVTAVESGMTGIKAYDASGNYEFWRVSVSA